MARLPGDSHAVDPGAHQKRLNEIATQLPGREEAQRLAASFQVLADPTRVRIISALLAAGELRVGDLAEVTGVSETACSQSLRLLRAERIVQFRKEGRSVFYALDDDHVRVLLDVARDHVNHTTAP